MWRSRLRIGVMQAGHSKLTFIALHAHYLLQLQTTALEQFRKGSSEVFIENRIKRRIYGRVEIAAPQRQPKDPFGNSVVKRPNQRHDEERRPRSQKCNDDRTEKVQNK